MRRQKAADKESQIREKPRRLQESAVMLRLIVADGLVHPREVHLLLRLLLLLLLLCHTWHTGSSTRGRCTCCCCCCCCCVMRGTLARPPEEGARAAALSVAAHRDLGVISARISARIPAQVQFLQDYALKNGVSQEEHDCALRELGWTKDEWTEGVKRDVKQVRDRAEVVPRSAHSSSPRL